jgi:hypothetical protein
MDPDDFRHNDIYLSLYLFPVSSLLVLVLVVSFFGEQRTTTNLDSDVSWSDIYMYREEEHVMIFSLVEIV